VTVTEKYKLKIVVGTDPLPEKYLKTRTNLGTWESDEWQEFIQPAMASEEIRLAYD